MILKSLRTAQCMTLQAQRVSVMVSSQHNSLQTVHRQYASNWTIPAVSQWMKSKTKQDKLTKKELKSKMKDSQDVSSIVASEDDENAMITESDQKSGKVRFQRNVPGKPTVWEGEVIGHLQNVKKTKKGMINFHNWEMTRQAVLLCPSAKRGLMPMRKELQFIFPRAVWGVDVHGGFVEVARKLGLKPHRKAPFYIPYLEPTEQYEFIQSQIDR